MNRIDVSSRSDDVQSIGWILTAYHPVQLTIGDTTRTEVITYGTLEIVYARTGTVYTANHVPHATVLELLAADSIGSLLRELAKSKKLTLRKVIP
jgi:hypothetical protein